MHDNQITTRFRSYSMSAIAYLCLLVVAVFGTSLHAVGLTPHQEAINQAIQDGCAYLESTQNQYDLGAVEYGYWDPGFGGNAYVAGTGMALLALVSKWEAAVPGADPVVDDEYIRRSVNYLVDNQLPDGTWGGNVTYQISSAVWGLAALLEKLPPGSPSIGPVQTAIDDAKVWLIASQWDEACLWGSVNPSNTYYYGGFGYGSHSRPDLSNSQFALVALKAAHLAGASDTWTKATQYVEECQYKYHSDGGMWYTPDYPVWHSGTGSTGSMTGAGVWSYRLCGVPVADSRVQDGLDWLNTNYTYTTNPGGISTHSHYYYLWSAAKAFLVSDIKGEIGGTIPVVPADAIAFDAGWYYDFSKYLVAQQYTDGHWNSGSYNGGNIMDTEYALFILQKEVGIPYAVLVSIAPDEVTVPPGAPADFTVTVENIGTDEDSYDMDILDLPSGFAWAMSDPVLNVPSGASVPLPLAITPPSDLAIWENTPYPFRVEATSLSDANISHATSAVVVITAQATPGSRVHYTDELLEALMAEVEAADIPNGVKNSLLAKLQNAEKKKHQGLAKLEDGKPKVAMNMFNAAANMVAAFVNEVEAQRGKKIGEPDADSFIAQAEDIIWRLEEGIFEAPAPRIAISLVPDGFQLDQNYPNPFNPTTLISFTLPEATHVKLEIYNIMGQLVSTVVEGYREAGNHTAIWNGNDAASGIYLYRLEAGEFVNTKKMVLLK